MALPLIYLWLSLIFLFLVFLMHRKNNDHGTMYNLPPGPKKLPIVGNLHQISELPHRSFSALSQKYGPLMYLQLGSVPTVVVSSAAMAKEVLKTHDLDCCSRPSSFVALAKITYGGLNCGMAPYGEYWREMKKTYLLELFSVKRVQSYRSIREEEVDLMLKEISSSSPLPVNLCKMATSLSYKIICRTALGSSCLEEGYVKSIHRISRELDGILISFFFSDYFPSMKWLDRITGKLARMNRSAGELDLFCEKVIEDHLDPSRVKPEEEDLVDVLLKLQREANHTRAHLKASITSDIFAGAAETTPSVITWAMAELIRNPGVLKKAQDEVRNSVGSKGKVEEEDLNQLNYLKCVIKEAMRLHPPAPLLLPRETIRHFKIDGYDMLPNMRVFVNAWAIGRDPNSWDNPDEFKPDRFLKSSIDVKGQDFELIPFGSGRRICPAMNFAAVIVELVLANLLYMFEWKLPNGMSEEDIDMAETPGLGMHLKSDLYIIGMKHAKIGDEDKISF